MVVIHNVHECAEPAAARSLLYLAHDRPAQPAYATGSSLRWLSLPKVCDAKDNADSNGFGQQPEHVSEHVSTNVFDLQLFE